MAVVTAGRLPLTPRTAVSRIDPRLRSGVFFCFWRPSGSFPSQQSSPDTAATAATFSALGCHALIYHLPLSGASVMSTTSWVVLGVVVVLVVWIIMIYSPRPRRLCFQRLAEVGQNRVFRLDKVLFTIRPRPAWSSPHGHALAICGLGVALDLHQRGVTGDACDLVCAAADLGEPPRRCLAQAVR